VYLINNQRIRHAIGLEKSNNGHWKLTGTNWSRFINRSGYGDIATLHFIWEGEDTFYVTGYDEHGSEIGRYNDLMTQQRRSRILVTLGNDLGESLDIFQNLHLLISLTKSSIILHQLVEFFNDDSDPFVSLLVSFVSSNL
ncbi:hypothetical protein Tco_1333280, partial [Tanacetum coccineum]